MAAIEPVSSREVGEKNVADGGNAGNGGGPERYSSSFVFWRSFLLILDIPLIILGIYAATGLDITHAMNLNTQLYGYSQLMIYLTIIPGSLSAAWAGAQIIVARSQMRLGAFTISTLAISAVDLIFAGLFAASGAVIVVLTEPLFGGQLRNGSYGPFGASQGWLIRDYDSSKEWQAANAILFFLFANMALYLGIFVGSVYVSLWSRHRK